MKKFSPDEILMRVAIGKKVSYNTVQAWLRNVRGHDRSGFRRRRDWFGTSIFKEGLRIWCFSPTTDAAPFAVVGKPTQLRVFRLSGPFDWHNAFVPFKTGCLWLARRNFTQRNTETEVHYGSGPKTGKEALYCSYFPDARCHLCQSRAPGKGRTER
jgi:hypothetical protein